jgi:hypothetical protein
MVDERLVDRLERDLLEDLEDDWVSVMAMVWSAQHVLNLTDLTEIQEVITATLVRLLDNPTVKLVTGGMGHTLTTERELVEHMSSEWPTDGEIPVSGEVVWLVERDFELRQREAGPD